MQGENQPMQGEIEHWKTQNIKEWIIILVGSSLSPHVEVPYITLCGLYLTLLKVTLCELNLNLCEVTSHECDAQDIHPLNSDKRM